MFLRMLVLALAAAPSITAAQEVPADSARHIQDTVARAPVKLHEITVTTTPARREEPTSVVQVPAAELQQTPAINSYELLRQTAGLEVHDQGQGPGFAATASLRGFSSDHSTDLALWIDGVPVNEPVNAHSEGYNDWSLLFPAVIREIDVYRGPSSALFGNFALAGTVNVRTVERYSGTNATLSGGAYGHAEGIGLAGFDRPGAGGLFALRGVREDGWRPHSGYNMGQAHGRVVRDLSPATSLDAGVELYAAGWDSPGFLTADQFANSQFDVVVDSTDGGFKRRAQERVSLRVLSGGTRIWRTTLYATQGRWHLFLNIPPEPGSGEGTGSQTEEEDRRYGFGLTSALTWSLPQGEITLGTEGRWDHSDYENYLTVARVRQAPQNLVEARQLGGALFAQSSIDLLPQVRINAGARFDAFDTRSTPDDAAQLSGSQKILSPKLGALYQFRPELQVYANVSRGFRQSDGVVNEPSLPLITAWSYESGVKVGTSRTRASLTLFRMDVSNEQTFDPISLTTTSGGRSRRQGVELGARAGLTPAVTVEGELTLNDAKYRDLITEDGDTLTGARVFNTAKYFGSAAVEAGPPAARWRIRFGTNVVGPYTPFEADGAELPAYALFHVSGTLGIGHTELQLGVRNLFNHTYPELRAGDFVAPGQPRSVYATARYGW